VDENANCAQVRLGDAVNVRKPLLVLKVPEVQWLLFRLSQLCPDAVNQFHGIKVFDLAGDGRAKDKPIGASATERKALIAGLVDVNNKGSAQSPSSGSREL
jgi:hypothetical protein